MTRVGASESGQRASFNRDRNLADEPHWLVFGCPSVLLLSPLLIYCELMRLRLVVEHDSKTKRWAAFFPELPGCASAGDTEDEAIQNAKEALELWFEPAPVDLPAGAKVLEVALT